MASPQDQQPLLAQNNMGIDLNVGLPNMDMQEVIINPAAAPDAMNEGFLELNNLMQEADEEVIQLAAQNHGFNLNDLPAETVQQQVNEEVHIPHVNLSIEPVIDDSYEEIPYHMLLNENEQDSEDDENEEQTIENAENHVMQIGAVLLRNETSVDPILLHKKNSSMDSFNEAWLAALENIPRKNVKVAAQWAPFFTSLLLSPANYKWAKSFIESEAWAFFNKSLKTSSIRIPDKGPQNKLSLSCINSEFGPPLLLS